MNFIHHINSTVFLDKVMNNIKHFTYFLILSILFTGCGKSPELVFSKAEENFNEGAYGQAIRGFKKIIAKYDDWDRINEAQEYINNFSGKIYSHAETLRNEKKFNKSIDALNYIVNNFKDLSIAPKSQYMIGDIYMNDLKDFKEAITHYNDVVKSFPGTKEEPHAQFMMGYIFANSPDVKDSTKAIKEYHLFLEKYPNHELAPSVQFEIEWLGKDINDIPALKHISS